MISILGKRIISDKVIEFIEFIVENEKKTTTGAQITSKKILVGNKIGSL